MLSINNFWVSKAIYESTKLGIPEILKDGPQEYGIEEELKARCELIAGDFFIEIPANKDIYIIRKVLHNWNDEEALKILKTCYKAMSKKSKLFIIDLILPCNIPFVGEFLALNAMVIGGKERFKKEFQDLLHMAGFKVENIISTKCQNSIIEVSKNY